MVLAHSFLDSILNVVSVTETYFVTFSFLFLFLLLKVSNDRFCMVYTKPLYIIESFVLMHHYYIELKVLLCQR